MEFSIRIEGTLKGVENEAFTLADAAKTDGAKAAAKVVDQLRKLGEISHASFSSGHVMGGSLDLLAGGGEDEAGSVSAGDTTGGPAESA